MKAITFGHTRVLNKIEFNGTTYHLVDQLDGNPNQNCNGCVWDGKCSDDDTLWHTFVRSKHDEDVCMKHPMAVWKPVIILSKKEQMMSNVKLSTHHSKLVDRAFIASSIQQLEIEIRDLVIRSTMLEKMEKVLLRTSRLCGKWSRVGMDYYYQSLSIEKRLNRVNTKKKYYQDLNVMLVNALKYHQEVLLSKEDYVTLCTIMKLS